ncbi:hypothetical protein [Streptomyces sp. NPDC053542]|uniref:hypothetical protein n=1 Tax=Streptomyces sp. NPDC053542 TaxID=3365710 RepID=UPI0037D17DE3
MGIGEMEARAQKDLARNRDGGAPRTLSSDGLKALLARRLPLWLRIVVVLAAGAGVVAGTQWTADAYRYTVAHQRAADCAARTPGTNDSTATAGSAGGCIGRAAARVLTKTESTGSCSSGSGGTRSCDTTYELQLVRASQRTESLDVAEDTYDAARRGSRAELRTWQGTIVGITVRGHTQSFPPPSQVSMRLRTMAGWLLLGLALWAGLSGRPNGLVRGTALGWAFLALPVALLTDYTVLGAGPLGWTVASALTAATAAFTSLAFWSARRPKPA